MNFAVLLSGHRRFFFRVSRRGMLGLGDANNSATVVLRNAVSICSIAALELADFVAPDDEVSAKAADNATAQSSPKDAAVERARREVQMIDTIYKTSIVLTTENYVNDDDVLPAVAP